MLLFRLVNGLHKRRPFYEFDLFAFVHPEIL